MDGQMSTRQILLLAVILGFAAGFSWVLLTGGPANVAAEKPLNAYASAD